MTCKGPFQPNPFYDSTYTLCLDATLRSNMCRRILALCEISSKLGFTVPINGFLVHKLIFCEGGSEEYAT